LIGTPGRIADHIKRATFSREAVATLVLDEFDKSLALGFEEDMSYIFGSLKHLDKKIFVSATASVDIPEFAGAADDLTVLNYIDDIQNAMHSR
jgi:ATP-dependent RNA helicase DeaD